MWNKSWLWRRTKVRSQHKKLNWTDLDWPTSRHHTTRSLVARVCFTTWLAAAKLWRPVLSQFWTSYSNAVVHTGVRELEFSSAHVLWTKLYGCEYERAISHAALFSAAPDCRWRRRLSRFLHDDIFFHRHFRSLIYNDDDRALHDL